MNTARALESPETAKTDMSEAVRQAIATMRLEGFEFSEKELEDLELIAQGKITPEESINKIIRDIEQLRINRSGSRSL